MTAPGATPPLGAAPIPPSTHEPEGEVVTASLFRKKPVVIEAQHWNGSVGWATAIIDWMLVNGGTGRFHDDGETPLGAFIAIDTLEGTMRAMPGDWVIKGVQGEFYPCKPDVFEATYQPVVGDAS